MKKRTLALMLSAALCVGLLAGCGSGNNDPVNTPAAGGSETPSQESTAALSGTVNTNGSTSMESVMGYLTEGFKEVQPGITVNYDVPAPAPAPASPAPRTAPATSAWPPAT